MKTSHKIIIASAITVTLVTLAYVYFESKSLQNNKQKLHAITQEDVKKLEDYTQIISK